MKRDLGINKNFTGVSRIPDMEHEPISGAKKTINGIGYLQFIGSGTTVRTIDSGAWVAVFNASSSIAYVGAGDASVSTPAAPGINAWPLPPQQWTLLCVGQNSHVRGGSADVHIYLADNNTKLS